MIVPSVVIGAGFGDEGKGHVTAWLASKAPDATIVRFNGGHQAGHNVNSRKLNKSHVFSNFGSGTLHGNPTYWSQFCTVDPVGFMREHGLLVYKDIIPRILVHPDCPVTTPYDKAITTTDKTYKANGTVGVGFGSTWQREEDHYSLTVRDLAHPSIVHMKLKGIASYYNWIPIPEKSIEEFMKATEEYMKCVEITDVVPSTTRIFEGAQGLMLDPDIGFFPHVTRSSVSTRNVDSIVGSTALKHVYLVTRAYATRHGNGPLPNEGMDNTFIAESPHETNLNDGPQGTFRRTILDTRTLHYAIGKGIHQKATKTLVVTCLDHMLAFRFVDRKGVEVKCRDKYEFIDRVAEDLEIKSLFFSDSRFVENVMEYKR